MKKTEKRLVQLFLRNGCIRMPNETRKEEEGGKKYKKGYEVRLCARNKEETDEAEQLLANAGFKAGKPYSKAINLTVIPVYGRGQVEKFQKLLAKAVF